MKPSPFAFIAGETLGTTTPPGTTRSLVTVSLSSIRVEPDGTGLQPVNRISHVRSYPYPITDTAFSAADCG